MTAIPTLRMNSSNNSMASYRMAHRIRFKLDTLTFKALHTGSSPYLSDLLQYHESTRYLCSSSTHLQLSVPCYNLTCGILDLVLFGFAPQEFEIHYPSSVSVNLSHFLPLDVIERHFIFSQPTPPPSAAHLA